MFDNGTWYAYATNNAAGILGRTEVALNSNEGAAYVQLATSQDFVNWTIRSLEQQPLPNLGEWVLKGMNGPTKNTQATTKAAVWAPSVTRRRIDNNYVLYYSAVNNATIIPGHHKHCIGAAVSESGSPAGPFKALNESIACPIEHGGAIDPWPVFDEEGTLYVACKSLQ